MDLTTNSLFYRKSIEDQYLKVPKIEDRLEIMEQAHLLGHFNALSTSKRIKEAYLAETSG